MRVMYLNCGIMRPRGAGIIVPRLARVPCLCLLMECGNMLVLVDAGLGKGDIEEPSRLGASNAVLNAQRDILHTAAGQVKARGFEPEQVTDIICTHLDRDHAGGISDFPEARVHVMADELSAALHPSCHRERERYRRCHFAHHPRWVAHQRTGADVWLGLERLGGIPGLPPGVSLVPLPGHTRGHCGVAVETGEGWLLHCGDAFYVGEELEGNSKVPAGVRAFRRLAHMDHRQALLQLFSLSRALEEGAGALKLICSHDSALEQELTSRAGNGIANPGAR